MTKCEQLAAWDPEILVMEEYESALTGVVTRFGMGPIALYDKAKVLEILELQMGDELAAIEWFEYNIIGAWAGEYTPAFVEWLEKE